VYIDTPLSSIKIKVDKKSKNMLDLNHIENIFPTLNHPILVNRRLQGEILKDSITFQKSKFSNFFVNVSTPEGFYIESLSWFLFGITQPDLEFENKKLQLDNGETGEVLGYYDYTIENLYDPISKMTISYLDIIESSK
jgi:hypothetical protein